MRLTDRGRSSSRRTPTSFHLSTWSGSACPMSLANLTKKSATNYVGFSSKPTSSPRDNIPMSGSGPVRPSISSLRKTFPKWRRGKVKVERLFSLVRLRDLSTACRITARMLSKNCVETSEGSDAHLIRSVGVCFWSVAFHDEQREYNDQDFLARVHIGARRLPPKVRSTLQLFRTARCACQ